MAEQRPTPSRKEGDLYDAAEEFIGGVGRLGYGLLALPLSLLPRETRTHLERAVREMGYSFARLPAEFADIAGAEIERWAAEGEEEPAPRRPRHAGPQAQHLNVTITPADLATPPAAPPAPASGPPLGQVEVLLDKAAPAGVGIAHIEYNPPGSDLAGEYVLLRNSSAAPVDLAGWRLSDGGAIHTFVFPPFTLAPGAELRVWTKAGVSDAANLYWGSRGPIWNNSGDSASLADAEGGLVSSYSYEAGG